jgi:hypothetical protein
MHRGVTPGAARHDRADNTRAVRMPKRAWPVVHSAGARRDSGRCTAEPQAPVDIQSRIPRCAWGNAAHAVSEGIVHARLPDQLYEINRVNFVRDPGHQPSWEGNGNRTGTLSTATRRSRMPSTPWW